MYKSRKELKALARKQMQGRYKTLIGAFILQTIITFLLETTVQTLFPSNDFLSNLFYFAISLAVSAFLGAVTAGMTFVSMAVACGMNCKASDIYRSFQANPGKAVWLQLPIAIIYMLCTLPANLMSLLTPLDVYASQLGTILILNGLGIIAASLFSLPFSLVFYMYWDFPEYNAKYILKRSIDLMSGNYMRYLGLQLSFLPLELLSILSFGIGSLWVTPYINITNANFYLNLMAKRNNE